MKNKVFFDDQDQDSNSSIDKSIVEEEEEVTNLTKSIKRLPSIANVKAAVKLLVKDKDGESQKVNIYNI